MTAAAPVQEPPPTATQPAKRIPKGLTPFNSETARLNSKKYWDAVRQAKEAPPKPSEPAAPSPNGQWTEELEIVQEQITRTREQLREKMEPGERAQLVRALDLMLDRKRILLEKPLPGSRRPAAESSSRRPSLFGSPAAEGQAPQGASSQEQE